MKLLKFIFGKTDRVKLVQEYDFPEYLKKIGAYDEIISKSRFCTSCGRPITIENLQAIIPLNGSESIRFVCDESGCLSKLKLNND